MGMMNNVSFKGTYLIPHNYLTNTPCAIKSVRDSLPESSGVRVFGRPKEKDHQGDTTFVVDDGFDKKLEALLQAKNIKFEKRPHKEIYDKDNILNRIEPAGSFTQDRFRLLDFKTKAVDALCEKCGITPRLYCTNQAWDKERREFLTVLKSGTRIDPPVVKLYKDDNGDLKIGFEKGYAGYTVLKEMGFEAIPMIIDYRKMNLAEKQGLVVQYGKQGRPV